MKISMYQPWLYLHGGLEKSLLELVQRSRHEWTIFTSHYDPEGTFKEFRDLDVRELNKVSVDRGIGSVLRVARQIYQERLPLDEDSEALVVWCDGLGDLITFNNQSLPTFNICSTPLRAAFDPVYEHSAMEQRGGIGKIAYQFFKLLFRMVDRKAWRNYDGVVATSMEVKSRIIDGGLYKDGEQMIMAYPGIEWSEDTGSLQHQPVILVPGRIMWTKNIELALNAFLKANLPSPWKLVIAGYLDEKSKPYIEKLRSLSQGSEQVEYIECPSSEELKELYRNASICLFPPLNEDWGIVPLEAMAHAMPVIANNRGGPSESVLNGKTGLLLEPNVDEWAQGIRQLADSGESIKKMGMEAHRHVEQYRWEYFVERIDDAIETWVKPSGTEQANV